MSEKRNEWQCITCGACLGYIEGGELRPAVPGECCLTRGPNLLVICPHCGFRKVFYTSDPVVRALYQLVDALASVAARRMVETISKETLEVVRQELSKNP